MWYGKNTPELDELNKAYEDIFGCYPCDYLEVDYGQPEYDNYIHDIKEAIKRRIELPSVTV